MKERLLLLGIIVALGSAIAQAQSSSDLREKVAAASPLPNVAHTKPLVIRGTITLPRPKGATEEGSFIRIIAPDKSGRDEYSFPDFQEVDIYRDHKSFMKRSVPFEPLALYYLKDAIGQIPLSSGDQLKSHGRKSIGGIPATCVDVRQESGFSRKLCFDQKTGVLLTSTFVPDLLLEYSDYVQKDGLQYPATIRVKEGHKTWAELKITDVIEEDVPASKFEPLPTAKVFTGCEGPHEDLKRIGGERPVYPPDAKRRHLGGRVTIYTVIGVDGKPHDATVVESAGRELDSAALAAVNTWRYKPFSCGGVPTEIESMIAVNFRN